MESFGRLLTGHQDALPGYRLEMLEITNAAVLASSQQAFHPIAILTQNPNDQIPGMVFEITEEEMVAADAYEVDDYTRISVTLASGKQAWVYVQKEK